MNYNSFYLNERVKIINETATQYKIEYEDGYKEWVNQDEVTTYVIKKRSKIKPVNKERRDKNFDKYYGSVERVNQIKKMPCLICGTLPSDCAHTVSKSAGGDYTKIVNLCRKHHLESHQIGTETFQEKYNVDLALEAEKLARMFPINPS